MSNYTASDSADVAVAAPSEKQTGRVWRACLECRKKKSKCDGENTCRGCRTRNRDCIYPESNDNASSSRQVIATLDERCKRMDDLCQKMEVMIAKFNEVVGNLDGLRGVTNQSAPQQVDSQEIFIQPDLEIIDFSTVPQDNEHAMEMDDVEDETESEDQSVAVQDHVMTTDSYGKLRFVGGTGTMVMVEALKSLGSPDSLSNGPLTPEETRQPEKSISIVELPFFVRGHTWPTIPYLPKSEQLVLPPRYVSDLLINLYFDQLHFTLPVIYRPHFMQRYNILLSERSPANIDTGFLSVFFGVCACASSLLPREQGTSPMFTGLQYYESALLLHFKSTGEGSIEQVQCLALLSMCTAGWNTLAQSWKFAGQAVRAAQDLGLHRSPERGTGETLKEELCRRIWWSVYGLDRLLAICLGRPIGIEDTDCNCEIPLDLSDDMLSTYCLSSPSTRTKPTTPSRLTGFIAFSKLCQISGKILRAINPLHLRTTNPKRLRERERVVASLDAELGEWLKNVPDCIRFSANETCGQGAESSHLTMCVILYIVHAGCVINLHRPLILDPQDAALSFDDTSLNHCVDAARSCIQMAELIQAHVPPSHHLAFCTHYLALSGVFLLRTANPTEHTPSIESCIRYLANLESVWAGANRSRLIIEELLAQARVKTHVPQWNFDGFGTDDIAFMLRQESSDFGFTEFT